MGQSDIQVPVDSDGKLVDTQVTVGGHHRQVIVFGDPSVDAAVASVSNSDPAETAYGMPTREVPSPVSGYHLITAATTNAANIKNSAAKLFAVRIFNNAGYPVFVKLFNKATAPVPGTDTPLRTYGCQAGEPRDVEIPSGMDFATGLGIAVVKNIMDNDATAVALNDASVEVEYK